MTKEDIQQKITDTIIDNNYTGIVVAAMRSGKTKIIIDALKKFKGSVLWVTDGVKLRDVEIPNEFIKWKGNIKKVTIKCYSSLKNIDKFYDLIILDECQKLTPNNIKYLKDRYMYLLACTGTLPNKQEKTDLYSSLKLKVIYKLSVDDAVSSKIIAPYSIEIWNLDLDSVNKNVKVEHKDSKTNRATSFYTTELKRYKYLSNRIAQLGAMGEPVKFHAINRMRFLGGLKSKENIISKYLADNINEKILIFCSTIAQAEKITPLSYHSKTDDACFNQFIKGKIDHMSVVSMVDTGVTFPHVDTIFMLSSNSSNVQSIQRIGRALMYKPNFVAKVIILCMNNTVEVSWIRNALLELNSNNIKYINI